MFTFRKYFSIIIAAVAPMLAAGIFAGFSAAQTEPSPEEPPPCCDTATSIPPSEETNPPPSEEPQAVLGITLRDQAAGEIFCMQMTNGTLALIAGTCAGDETIQNGLQMQDTATSLAACVQVRTGVLTTASGACGFAAETLSGIYLQDMITGAVSCMQVSNGSIIVNGECISANPPGETGGSGNSPEESSPPPCCESATSTPPSEETNPPSEEEDPPATEPTPSPPPPPPPPPPRDLFGIPPDFLFVRDLRFDSNPEFTTKVSDVRYLQIILNRTLAEPVSRAGHGSPGEETAFFGEKTRDAVIRFQEFFREEILDPLGLSAGTGFVGVSTRAKLNEFLQPLSLYPELRNLAERKSDILAAVNGYREFLPAFFERGLILGAIIKEIGGSDYNNEWVRPNKPADFGRGVMQITTNGYVGAGNNGCGANTSCQDCGNQQNGEYQCCQYYFNTSEGIERNVRDGLFALREKYEESNCRYDYDIKIYGVKSPGELFDVAVSPDIVFRVQTLGGHESLVREIRGQEATLSCAQSPEDFRTIDTFWRYNGRLKEPPDSCQASDYLRCLADVIDLDTAAQSVKQIFGYAVPEKDAWARKLRFVHNARTVVFAIKSPAEIRTYDSFGRIAGSVDGETREEIPFSQYRPASETLIIPFAYGTYEYEIAGTATGTYGAVIQFKENGDEVSFVAADIPTTPQAIHKYTIDDERIAKNEKAVTLTVDQNGDGIFESTVVSDGSLTAKEFMLQTETKVDIAPETLNLKSAGKVITAYIELPLGYDVQDIDAASVRLNETVPALAKPVEVGDYDSDGTPDLMVKFDRSAAQAILDSNDMREVKVGVSGTILHQNAVLDFRGNDTITLIKK